VDTDRLIFGIAAVFAGVTALLAVLAFVFRQLFLLFVAVPFAAATYFMWYHATGRLERKARARGRRVRSDRFRAGAAGRGAGSPGGPGPTGGPGAGGAAGPGAGRRRAPTAPSLSEAEAYRRLGVEPGADRETVKRAYRRRVKEVHPDTDTGSEEAFKKVNEAYERLSE
jgi:hypothetical protein